jgi:hypothetical protein
VALAIDLGEVADDPGAAAIVAEADQEGEHIHRGCQPGSDRIDIPYEPAARIHDDEWNVEWLFVATADLTCHETVRAGIFPVV